MRYTRRETSIIIILAIVCIVCFAAFSLFVMTMGLPPSLSTIFSISGNFYILYLISLLIACIESMALIGILIFIIKGIINGYKSELSSKLFIFAIFIDIAYIILFNPIYYWNISHMTWLILDFLGVIFAISLLLLLDYNKIVSFKEDKHQKMAFNQINDKSKISIYSKIKNRFLNILAIVCSILVLTIFISNFFISNFFNNLDSITNITHSASPFINFLSLAVFIVSGVILIVLIRKLLVLCIVNFKKSFIIYSPLILINLLIMIIFHPNTYIELTFFGCQSIYLLVFIFCLVLIWTENVKFMKIENINPIRRYNNKQIFLSIFSFIAILGCLLFIAINITIIVHQKAFLDIFFSTSIYSYILYSLFYIAMFGLLYLNINNLLSSNSKKTKFYFKYLLCILIFFIIIFFPYQFLLSAKIIFFLNSIYSVWWIIACIIGLLYFYYLHFYTINNSYKK